MDLHRYDSFDGETPGSCLAFFRQFLIYYEQQDYFQADACFREVKERSQAIGWQRPAIFAQNRLADLAIIDGRFDEAEDLLQTGLPIAERNKDKRRSAHYERSFAYLRKKQGNRDETYRWARKAFDGFERLGMQLETKEMQELL